MDEHAFLSACTADLQAWANDCVAIDGGSVADHCQSIPWPPTPQQLSSLTSTSATGQAALHSALLSLVPARGSALQHGLRRAHWVLHMLPSTVTHVDAMGRTPLHAAVRSVAGLQAAPSVLRAYPGAVLVADSGGQTPVHAASAGLHRGATPLQRWGSSCLQRRLAAASSLCRAMEDVQLSTGPSTIASSPQHSSASVQSTYSQALAAWVAPSWVCYPVSSTTRPATPRAASSGLRARARQLGGLALAMTHIFALAPLQCALLAALNMLQWVWSRGAALLIPAYAACLAWAALSQEPATSVLATSFRLVLLSMVALVSALYASMQLSRPLPISSQPEAHALRAQLVQQLRSSQQGPTLPASLAHEQRWCPSCGVVLPDRAKHDAHSSACYRDFDHYCPWVASAVTQDNYGLYLALLSLATCTAWCWELGLLVGWVSLGQHVSWLGVLLWAALPACMAAFGSLLCFQHARLLQAGLSTNEARNWKRYSWLNAASATPAAPARYIGPTKMPLQRALSNGLKLASAQGAAAATAWSRSVGCGVGACRRCQSRPARD